MVNKCLLNVNAMEIFVIKYTLCTYLPQQNLLQNTYQTDSPLKLKRLPKRYLLNSITNFSECGAQAKKLIKLHSSSGRA